MFAVASSERDHLHLLAFYGTDYHTHLAPGYGGLDMIGDELVQRIHNLENSQFKAEFAKELHLYDGAGNFAIGAISNQPQPITINPVNKRLGIFSICIHGYITNADSLAVELINQGIGFGYDEIDGTKIVNQAKLAGRFISTKSNFIDGINYVFEKIKGSISIFIMNCHGILAARSKYGQTLLTIGRKDKIWVIASETNSFPNLSITPVRMLAPGEIVLMDESGVETKYAGSSISRFCPFFWVYTGFPASEYYGLSAESYRENMGELHAKKDFESGFIPKAVCGVADSGTTYALGYANGSIDNGAPVKLLRPIVKYTPGWGRSYTPEKQLDRDKVALHKQIPIRDTWAKLQGQDIVFTEDSIVRGTQLGNLLHRLNHITYHIWGLEPARIHVRIGCPVLGWHCPYLGTTKSREEMAARKAIARFKQVPIQSVSDDMLRPYLEYGSKLYQELVQAICRDIGASSLLYPSLDEMVAVTGLPRKDLCLHCWTGDGA